MRRALAALALALPALSGCVVGVGNDSAARAAPPPAAVSPKLAGMQYLYGSAEADAITRQAWAGLVAYVADRIRQPAKDSVVLAETAGLDASRFEACEGKPPAVILDIDETAILNLGFEEDDLTGAEGRPFKPRWAEFEAKGAGAVDPTPGAREAIAQLRRLGVAVVFNSNRDDAGGAARALDAAGLGPVVHGDTLLVRTDTNTGDLKDARRWRTADRYCVVAMGGDQLGDFSDLFNDPATVAGRRARADGDGRAGGVAALWGRGWFVFPNPVYGKALAGSADEIFPAARRWHPTGEQ